MKQALSNSRMHMPDARLKLAIDVSLSKVELGETIGVGGGKISFSQGCADPGKSYGSGSGSFSKKFYGSGSGSETDPTKLKKLLWDLIKSKYFEGQKMPSINPLPSLIENIIVSSA